MDLRARKDKGPDWERRSFWVNVARFLLAVLRCPGE